MVPVAVLRPVFGRLVPAAGRAVIDLSPKRFGSSARILLQGAGAVRNRKFFVN